MEVLRDKAVSSRAALKTLSRFLEDAEGRLETLRKQGDAQSDVLVHLEHLHVVLRTERKRERLSQ